MPQSVQPVILSGGTGTRLWPLSRRSHPKQFLDLDNGGSMLAATIRRLAPLGTPVTILCSDEQRFLVAEQAKTTGVPARIVLEPVSRNTGFSVAAAALMGQERNPDAPLLIAPADHAIPDAEAFRADAATACAIAQRGHLVVFGIRPTQPHTGFGYIHAGEAIEGGHKVAAFKEKPDLATAEAYVADGGYLWNTGVFVGLPQTFLDAFQSHAPETLAAARAAVAAAQADLDFLRLDADAMAPAPDLSFDYAVMERVSDAAVVPAGFAWSDLGSWQALHEQAAKDEADTVTVGPVLAQDTAGCYLRSDGPLIAAVGARDTVVIATDDAVLVCPRDRAQDVGRLVDALKADGREEATEHRRILRPWGSYERVALGDRFQVKRIIVRPGGILSLQSHVHRAEHWVVVAGTAMVTIGQEEKMVTENQSVYIPLGEIHRLANPGKLDLVLIEVQTGAYLGEDDIRRYEDIYARG